MEQGALAYTGFSYDRQSLPFLQIHIKPPKYGDFPVAFKERFMKILNLKEIGH